MESSAPGLPRLSLARDGDALVIRVGGTWNLRTGIPGIAGSTAPSGPHRPVARQEVPGARTNISDPCVPTGDILVQRRTSHRVSPREPGPDGVVAGTSEALSALSRDIAEALKTVPPPHRFRRTITDTGDAGFWRTV